MCAQSGGRESGEVHLEISGCHWHHEVCVDWASGKKQISALDPRRPTAGHDIGTGHTESQCRTGGLSSVRRQRACLVTPSQRSEKRKSEILGGVRRGRRVLPARHLQQKPRPDAAEPAPGALGDMRPPRRRGAVDKLPCLAGWLFGGGCVGDSRHPVGQVLACSESTTGKD